MRNSVFHSPFLVEASWGTRHFVPLLLETGFYLARTADSCRSSFCLGEGQVMSFEDVIVMSPVTIPSSILIVDGSAPDLLSMVALTRTLPRSRDGRADPFHVAPSVAMNGLPCSPLCLVK